MPLKLLAEAVPKGTVFNLPEMVRGAEAAFRHTALGAKAWGTVSSRP